MYWVLQKEKVRRVHGFTLLELLLVIGIFSILAVTGVGYYRNYTKNISLDSIRDQMIFALKETRSRSALGDAGSGDVSLKWGVRVVNGVTDFYEVYSTPTNYADPLKNITTTTTLEPNVTFTDPSDASVKDILFDKITGSTTPTNIAFTYEGRVVTITVTELGVVY